MKFILVAILCLSALILKPGSVIAQKESNIWYFGKNAGLDFNTFPPKVLTDGKINTREGVASISDKFTGKLLFYTEGTTIWDATHTIMPNGSGLLGDYSSTQSSIIIPDPADIKKYYLFTTAIAKGLRFSQVNLNLNAGKGDVIPASKNTLLLPTSTSSEKLIAVQHCNKKDYWVITHTLFNNAFYVYLVNSSGVQPPLIYNVGSSLAGAGAWTAVGYLKLSPSGSKLAHAIGPASADASSVVELFNFNNNSGVISLPVAQLTFSGFPYGVEFSPNETMLYVSEVEGRRLHQFDLTAPVIAASRTMLASSPTLKYGALQLGPDGKIYVSIENGYDIGYGFLALIANPDIKGIGCNYTPDAISLNGSQTLIGLPTFLANYLKDTSGFRISGNCVSNNVDFTVTYSGNVDSLKWNFGDGSSTSYLLSPKHVYSAAGKYNVSLIVFRSCNEIIDTVNKEIVINALNSSLVNASICEGASYKLPNGTFVSKSGQYPSTFTSAAGCDSIVITNLAVAPLPGKVLGNDTAICANSSLLLKSGAGFTSYLWHNGSTEPDFLAAGPGLYWVEVQNAGGCRKKDSIVVGSIPGLAFSLGDDTSLCNNSAVSIGLSVAGASTYLWNTGSTVPEITINTPGLYWMEVQSPQGCRKRDSIQVGSKPVSNFSLGPDTAICLGQAITLGKSMPGSTYLWNTSSTSAEVNVTASGRYWVELNQQGCIGSDTIAITTNSLPIIAAQKTNDIDCDTPTSRLIGTGAEKYTWFPSTGLDNPGSNNPTVSIGLSTQYVLKGTDINGCSNYDSINVLVTNAGNSSFAMPNAFSPNADGMNDCFGLIQLGVTGKVEFAIYNRWGNKVFFSNDPRACWDGTLNGVPQNAGGFVYTIRAETLCGDFTKKGIVMLVR